MAIKVKKIIGTVKLQIKAQQATPAPPIGPAVGQYGINIMNFCKEFNERTKDVNLGAPVPALLTIYQDKSFSFILKTLPASYLIRQAGKKSPTGELYITTSDIMNIVQYKKEDLTAKDDIAGMNTIIGTAKSMKIKVQD